MKYVRGFLMAWGMFCWIPCPYKEWRMEDRKAQLVMLPLVGALIGVCVCLCWWLLSLIGCDGKDKLPSGSDPTTDTDLTPQQLEEILAEIEAGEAE